MREAIYYLFSILVGFFGISYASKQKNRFPSTFLSNYINFLFSFNISNFLNWIGFKILKSLSLEYYYSMLSFFASPFALVSLFFFFRIFSELLEIRLSKKYYFFFTFVFVMFLITNFISIVNAYNNNEIGLFIECVKYVNFTVIFIAILIPAVFLLLCRGEKDPFKRAWHSGFTLLFLFIMIILFIIPLSWFSFHVGGQTIDLLAFLFFAAPILPLYYASSYLKRHIRRYTFLDQDCLDIDRFSKQYAISQREQNVLELLIQGRSRKVMNEMLFISEKTVNVHLYHIYQKLGVKNRIEAMNLIQNFKKSQYSLMANKENTKNK